MSEVKVDGKDLVTKWEKTGLLEATPLKDQYELATLLEELAQYLINRKADELQGRLVSEETTEEIAGFVLPILVRLFNERREVCPTDTKLLLEDFEEHYSKNKQLIEDLNSYIAQDGEAEFCSLYVEGFKRK